MEEIVGPGLALAATVLVVGTALPTGSTAAGAGGEPIDDAWLQATHERLSAEHGEAFVDVGLAHEPDRHVAVLFDGPPPEPVPDLHERLATRAHDVSGAQPLSHGELVPIMKRTALDVPDQVRPGAWMTEPADCTLAHVLEDAGGNAYVLTAGHCANSSAPRHEDLGARVAIVTDTGPSGGANETVGTVADFVSDGVGQDYALIAIDAGDEHLVEPNMAGWQGPVGLAESEEPGSVHHYGFGSSGTWFHDATRCRAGSTPGFWGATSYAFHGLIGGGDSGSPAQTASGQALGINTHLGFAPTDPVFGNVLGTRTTHAIDSLEDRNGLSLSLATGAAQAPVCQVV